MKLIPLTQGKSAIIDDKNFDRFSKFKWHAMKSRNTFYAARTTNSGKKIYMHREVMEGKADGALIDHKDHNGLNNTEDNLRVSDHSTNAINCSPNRKRRTGKNGKSSRYLGVKRCQKKLFYTNKAGELRVYETKLKFEATIKVRRKQIQIGRFDKEVDAAIAYNEAASKHFGKFATLNVI